jgi:hypothetical protein
LAGAVAGYKPFSGACAVGDTVHYRIEAVNSQGVPTGPFEIGRGTYSAADTLTRTTVIESSNANAAVNFSGDLRASITVLSPATSQQVLLDWLGALSSYGAAGNMLQNDASATFEIKNNGGTGDTNMAMLRFNAVGNYQVKLGLRADGVFGVGGSTAATWRWYVNCANGDQVGAGNVTGYSDERLKTNWKDLPVNYVLRLAKVRVGVFDRLDTPLRQVGVSAQSLRKLLPWAVVKGKDGILSVAYGNAALASCVELAKDNVSLRKELNEERKARKALERRLDRIEKALTSTAKVKKK